MRFFYAQSSNNKIVVTAPWQTFASYQITDQAVGVIPYAYTDSSGRRSFKETDIKEVNYYPLNSKHFRIEVLFSNTFKPQGGATIQLKAVFAKSQNTQIFSLPYVKSSSVDIGRGSTEPRTLAISRENDLESPLTTFKVYVDGDYVETESYSSKAFSADISKYDSINRRLEYVGVTSSNITSSQILQAISNNQGKYLTTSNFTEVYNENSSYFYVYIENVSTEFIEFPTKTRTRGDDCFDSTASNYQSLAEINNNSCVYTLREPENIVIKTTVRNSLSDVLYIEKNLSSSTFTNATDFSSTTLTVKGVADTSPSTKALNIEGDFAVLQVGWENTEASLALDTYFNSSPTATISIKETVTGGGTGTTRGFTFPLLKIASIGCTDNTALNYDANAEEACADCCMYCEDLRAVLQAQWPGSGAVSAIATTNDVTDDDNTLVIGNFALQGSSDEYAFYLSQSPGSYWTINIYADADVVPDANLNNGDQATLLGSALVSDINDSSSANSVQHLTGPSNNSGLFPGQLYWAEYVFNNGAGCTWYVYQKFPVPYNGCLDPSATNYDPSPGNTGNGDCEYPDDITVCTQVVVAALSQPTLINNDQAITTLTIYGMSSDGENVDAFGIFTANYSLFDNSQTPPAFLGTFNIAENSAAGGNNPFTYNIIIPQNTTINVNIVDLGSTCGEVLTLDHPGIVTIGGCTDPFAVNYNPNANVDDGKCFYCDEFSITASSVNPTGDCEDSNCDGDISFEVNAPGDFQITLFSNLSSFQQQLAVNQTDVKNLCSAIYYATAVLYFSNIDNTCEVSTQSPIPLTVDTSGCGCTNPDAVNYNPAATTDDGSCLIVGCTNPLAINYNPDASFDGGNCIFSATYEPECIPDSVMTTVSPIDYETTLDNIKACVAQEGTRMLFKIRGGIICDTTEQIKLTLVSYLLNRIGLECLYNCNYTFPYTSNGGELPTGTETYLETFINFVRKYCTVCSVDQHLPTVNEQGESNILNFISFENGDNIDL